MYRKFYGLKEMPFSLTPDSRFLFLSIAHREALAHLLYGIRERKGFILVTGEIGTGKTTLCRALLNELGPDTEIAFIMNTFLSETELLRNVVYDLMAEGGEWSKKELIDRLNGFLLMSKSAGKNVVILIDECQNLSPEVMEQIRMLSNLETEREKLLQIILVGQPEVRDILAMPAMRQLDQRIAVRYHLRPLSGRETGKYIRHRLEVAGLKGDLKFKSGALHEIYRYSCGTPRLINIICDRALLVGYVNGVRAIGRGILRIAESELAGAARRREREKFLSLKISPLRLVKAALAVSIVFVAFLGWVNRERLLVAGRDAEPQVSWGAAESVVAGMEEPRTIAAAVSFEGGAGDEVAGKPLSLPPVVLATERLLRLWGYEGSPSRDDTIEGMVERSGLETVASWAGLPFILKVNLPCILEAGGDYYVLERIDGDNALCWWKGEAVSIPLSDLCRLWDGRVFIVNRHVNSRDPLYYRSMRGNDVWEIQTGLGELKYYRGEATGRFDGSTETAVMKFQTDLGLNADGIVGPETYLALWSMIAEGEAPRLISGHPHPPLRPGTSAGAPPEDVLGLVR